MDVETDPTKKKRFFWGVLLAWVPFVFLTFPTGVMFISSLSREKASGLGAVAGGLSESLTTFGIAVTLASELIALVLLFRAFSKGHPLRSFLSVLSICCSALVLLGFGLFAWVFLRFAHR